VKGRAALRESHHARRGEVKPKRSPVNARRLRTRIYVRWREGTGHRSSPPNSSLLRARSIPRHSRRDLDLAPLHPIPTSRNNPARGRRAIVTHPTPHARTQMALEAGGSSGDDVERGSVRVDAARTQRCGDGRATRRKKNKSATGLCATSAKEREQTRKKQGDGRKHAYQKIADNPGG
jgi:hypothetical protein